MADSGLGRVVRRPAPCQKSCLALARAQPSSVGVAGAHPGQPLTRRIGSCRWAPDSHTRPEGPASRAGSAASCHEVLNFSGATHDYGVPGHEIAGVVHTGWSSVTRFKFRDQAGVGTDGRQLRGLWQLQARRGGLQRQHLSLRSGCCAWLSGVLKPSTALAAHAHPRGVVRVFHCGAGGFVVTDAV